MRIFCGALLVSMIASGVSFGQVPQDWDQRLADGLTAEDKAEYEVAEKLLGQACDVSLAQQLGPERLTRACLALSNAFLVQGKWEKAAVTKRTLVEAQSQFADATPERRAEALIRSAEAEMAEGHDKAAAAAIQAAIYLAREMAPGRAAAAFAEIAELYAEGGPKRFGGNLLEAAFGMLMAQPKRDTIIYVATATRVGRGLVAIKRSEDATKLLLPLVEAAENRVDAKPEHDELWGAYNSAASTAITALKMLRDDTQADRVRELQGRWPRVLTMGPGRIFPPTLVSQVEPEYPSPAVRHRIQGVVILSVLVGLDGRAHDIQVMKGLPYGLTWTAIDAVRKWRFNPAIRNGEPVTFRIQIELNVRRAD